jgi:basic amino acid/polyamine antiporter, APA family
MCSFAFRQATALPIHAKNGREWGPENANSLTEATDEPLTRTPETRLYLSHNSSAVPILPTDAKLVRQLSLSDSILLLAGGIIGSGIFLTAKDVAINTRHPWLFLTVWVIGMGMALLACFAFAELGSMFPHAGGQYVYMREAYGDAAGFLYGWMYFTVSATGTVAALGVGFATYLGQTFPALHAEKVVASLRFVDITRGHLIALAAIALQTLINIFGVKKGAVLQNIATWAKFGAIAVFVVGGLFLGRGSWDHFRHSLVPSGNEHVSIVTGVGIALIAVFWAYDGWVYITFVGGEVKDPQRNVPRALIWGLLLVGVVYISINAVYVYALPMNEIAAQEAVAQTAAVSMFSGRVAPWLSLMVAVSCFGAMAPCLMSGARVYYAMAEDGIFFHALAKIHPRWHTPIMSLVLQAIWASVLTLSGKYDELFTYVMFMMVLSYVLTVAGLFVLRWKKPDMPRAYRCTGYPVLPAIYVVLGSLWALNAAVEKKKETLVGTAIVLAGVPLYLWWKRRRVIPG